MTEMRNDVRFMEGIDFERAVRLMRRKGNAAPDAPA
jgi:hypothetical protein